MRILTLIENTPGKEECIFEHGLSLYIETKHHHLLMDTGATDSFLHNAERLGVDLGAVDTVILSHGHYDHTGGVLPFVKQNPRAAIYLKRNADGAFYHGEKYIGVDPELLFLPQLRWVDGDLWMDDELQLFSQITGRRAWPESNLGLSRKDSEGFLHQDDFSHEQCLVLTENEKHILISGCAHNGILNILDRYHELFGGEPDAVISGFHMMKKTEYTVSEIQTIRDIACELKKMKSVFFTGHCTGGSAYEIMKEIMDQQLRPIHSGEELIAF